VPPGLARYSAKLKTVILWVTKYISSAIFWPATTLNSTQYIAMMDDEMVVKSTSKRKASDIESPEIPKRKKKKKPRKSRNTDVADPDIDLEKGINLAIGRMDTNLLADHISQRTKRFAGDLTLLEMEEKRIPGTCGLAR
jgi:hypothetical protein